MRFVFENVDAYEARNNYWSGEILKKISGASLYMTTHAERPWGVFIHCDDNNQPHSVEFENGVVWSFCFLSERLRDIEWPMFIQDYPKGNCKLRIERIFSDSMHLTMVSENALLNDLLIWHHYPARPAAYKL